MSSRRESLSRNFILILSTCLVAGTAFASEDVVTCPTASEFKQALSDGTAKEMPHIVFQDGVRVQLQHPETYLAAHAKFFDHTERPGFSCQYYNYVGMVATAFYVNFDKAGTADTSFWREDYRDSLTEDFKAPNMVMTQVCMQRIDGQTDASVGCYFKSRD